VRGEQRVVRWTVGERSRERGVALLRAREQPLGRRRIDFRHEMSSASRGGPVAVNRATSSAITLRGHGHWPIAFRLFWSISTTTAGADLAYAGANAWQASNHAARRPEVKRHRCR
jgi:hypothetical protein